MYVVLGAAYFICKLQTDLFKKKFEKWRQLHPWLELDGKTETLNCSTCKSAKFATSVWTQWPGCPSLRIDVIKLHAASSAHRKAEQAVTAPAANTSSADAKAGTPKSTEMPTLEDMHLKLAQDAQRILLQRLKIVYFLAKQGRPMSDFQAQMDLQVLLGTPDVELNAAFAKRVKYDSSTFVNEALSAIAEWIWQKQLDALKRSSTFSALIDESVDEANVSELIIYLSAMGANGEPFTTFVDILPLKAGDAVHITTKLLEWLNSSGLDLTKFSGFGSDGAATITGIKNGASDHTLCMRTRS